MSGMANGMTMSVSFPFCSISSLTLLLFLLGIVDVCYGNFKCDTGVLKVRSLW